MALDNLTRDLPFGIYDDTAMVRKPHRWPWKNAATLTCEHGRIEHGSWVHPYTAAPARLLITSCTLPTSNHHGAQPGGLLSPFAIRLASAGIWLAAPINWRICGAGGSSSEFVQVTTHCA